MFRQSGNLAQPEVANNLFINTNEQLPPSHDVTAPPTNAGRGHFDFRKCQTGKKAFENA
jgi:hypothetical protein